MHGHGVNYKLSVKLLSFSGLPHDAVSICLAMYLDDILVTAQMREKLEGHLLQRK